MEERKEAMERKKTAISKKYEQGYNCSQAVACTFCDITEIDETMMYRIMSGFAVGMGGMKGTCGAVSAGVALIGLIMNNGDSKDVTQKKLVLKTAKEYTRRFAEKNQSLMCSELKGLESGTMIRSCDGCIEDAVEILEDMIEEGLIKK